MPLNLLFEVKRLQIIIVIAKFTWAKSGQILGGILESGHYLHQFVGKDDAYYTALIE
jgi:hypothetical protein